MRDPYFDRLPDYVAGRLDPETRDEIAVHLVACFACRQELRRLEAEAARAVAEAEGLLEEHLTDEQVERAARGELTDAERDRTHAHLGACTACEARVSAARERFRRPPVPAPPGIPVTAAPPAEPEKAEPTPPGPPWPEPEPGKPPEGPRWAAIVGALALIAIVWIVIGTYISRIGAPPTPLPVETPTVLAGATVAPGETPAETPVGTPGITPAVEETPAVGPTAAATPEATPRVVPPVVEAAPARVARLPRAARAVRPIQPERPRLLAVLKDGRAMTTVYADGRVDAGVELTPELRSAAATKVLTGQLPGGNPFQPIKPLAQPTEGPRLREPVGTTVASATPEFSWDSVAPDATYRVTVRGVTLNVTWQSPWTAGTTIRPPAGALMPGRSYRWWVEAQVGGKAMASAPSRIRVLSEEAAKLLGQQREQFGHSHLLMGVLYERLRLFVEAQAEYEQLARDNPDSPLALKLYIGLLERRGLPKEAIARKIEALR